MSSTAYQSYLRHSVLDDGGRVYETLLGLKRTETAAKFSKWMLTFSSDGEMYARLITCALNVNRTDVAADLFERATKTLMREEDLRLVRKAAKRLPGRTF